MDFEKTKNEISSVLSVIGGKNGIKKLSYVDDEYEAYVISNGDWFGVAIPTSKENFDFNFNFEKIRVCFEKKLLHGEEKYFLEMLTNFSFKDIARNNFVSLCLDFIAPGDNGNNRKLLNESPQEWVDYWRSLIGNGFINQYCYPLLGEMIILNYIFENDNSVRLTNQGSYDMDTNDYNIEVKTTTARYSSFIEIHNQYQLKPTNGKELYLFFVRLEKCVTGYSISSMLNLLQQKGYNTNSIEERIKKLNSEDLNECYRINEIRKYLIDNNFPKIIDSSFKDNKLPNNIIGLTYKVDLDGLKYKKIECHI